MSLSISQFLSALRQGVDLVKDQALHNLLLPMGMMWAFRQVLRCRQKGLGMLGIPCNSFTYMSCSQHKRTLTSPWGDIVYPFVVEGNALAARSVLVIMVLVARSIFWLTENPDRSALQFFPLLNHLMMIPEIGAMRIHWWGTRSHNQYAVLHRKTFKTKHITLLTDPRHMGPHGGWSLKPEFSYGNAQGSPRNAAVVMLGLSMEIHNVYNIIILTSFNNQLW